MTGLKPLPAQIHSAHPLQSLARASPPDRPPVASQQASSHSFRHPRRRHDQNPKDRVTSEAQHSIDVPNGRGAIPMRAGLHDQPGNGHARAPGRSGRGANAFDGPGSPPPSKNTSHVPCKFFRQGACQAGKACPFSHSVDPATTQAPCKYFTKGNCKFGAKCALAHVLPDGRVVNRPGLGPPGGMLELGGRVDPELHQNPPSALANSLLHAHLPPPAIGHQYPFSPPDDFSLTPTLAPPSIDGLPTIDTGFVPSRPDSNYGSPRDESRFPISPAIRGLSVLDAPLPASFDSNGVSWIARNGPVAASVPSKFGLESPPRSFRDPPASDALRTLHDSAYGNGDRSRPFHMASSPPSSHTPESSTIRIMHSQRQTKPKMMSASLPRAGVNDDWDNFAFEEEFIPNSLHELLTPQEKMRRFSRSAGDDDGGLNSRLSLSGVGTPGDPSSKVGSPLASSPSRFGPLFTRQRKEEDQSTPPTGLGHVGSPLRNSTLHPGASPALRAISRPTSGDISPYFASPSRQSPTSMISQQLQRTRVSKSDQASGDGTLHPGSGKPNGQPSGRMERAVSSSSMNNGRMVGSIDEEPGEVFDMEEVDDLRRSSGVWNPPADGRPPPRVGPIGDGRSVSGTVDGKESRGRFGSLGSLNVGR